ncbi:sodium:solute symporter family transporter, partial [Marinobacter alexandrii]|uniref:sodium:solute symporter family transporter n=1 Tax=Marinobacter alexandrii TaxID=2570351 RepID=UPI003299486B
VASDFVQTLVVAVVSVACAVVALVKVGGPVELVTNFPSGFVIGPDMNYPLLLVGTFVFFLAKQLITIMNLNDSFRFLNAKDSVNARKAALLAMGLMGVGSIIWFIPPWASAILYPDAASAYPDLGNKAGDAIYLVFARNAMPVGTVGLLMAGLFAASMSSMDSALNKNAGIFVRSVYSPFQLKRGTQVDDTKLLGLSRLVSFVSGIIVIGMALFFKSLQELSLFDLMMSVSAMIQVPLLIPLILGLFVRRTPQWAPWATVILGLFVSWFMKAVFTPQVFADLLGLAELTRREIGDLNLMLTLAAHAFITAGFFVSTSLLYSEKKDRYVQERTNFFVDLETPVIADDAQDDYDRQQRAKLGAMVMTMGVGVLLMTLIPNPMWGKAVFLCSALAISSVGIALRRSAR